MFFCGYDNVFETCDLIGPEIRIISLFHLPILSLLLVRILSYDLFILPWQVRDSLFLIPPLKLLFLFIISFRIGVSLFFVFQSIFIREGIFVRHEVGFKSLKILSGSWGVFYGGELILLFKSVDSNELLITDWPAFYSVIDQVEESFPAKLFLP